MTKLLAEIHCNYENFTKEWTAQAQANWNEFEDAKQLKDSYARLCALQAWKTSVLAANLTPASMAFFNEAHNDALTSHVNASLGAWRTSLQALRGSIENVLCCLYFQDHPIEYQLWEKKQFRIGFTELMNYFGKHPKLEMFPPGLTGLENLKTEYATLSLAVHGSAANFRMTSGEPMELLLWSQERAKLGQWAARHKRVIEGVCLLLTCLYSEGLQGTGHSQLRQVMYYSLTKPKRGMLRNQLHVNIPEPR